MTESSSVTIRGVDGSLYWGYHKVGTVRAWTATRSASEPGSLTATMGSYNPVWASQHPIEFVVQHQHGAWRWPLDSLQIADGTLTAAICPPER